MKKIVLLTCQEHDQVSDDHLFLEALKNSSRYEVDVIPWDSDHDWKKYDRAIVRTTWDYTKRIEEFLKKMRFIATQTKLSNPLSVIEWNHHKGYLKELEQKGVLIVPTVFFTFPQTVKISETWKDERFILKPCVSASAYNTMIVSRAEIENGTYQSKLFKTDWMLQPFLEEIKQGEISLHFFMGEFSHGIIKVPKSGDFRVQEEYGGNIISYVPDEKLLKLAQDILGKVSDPLLFARTDLVPYKGSYALMEMELIEPALYFRKDTEAAKRLVLALDKIT
jgi:glutathione synthase/RimK-type ligase-like ATP-grasp enzyme